ncbi:DUF3846 domain-containing protein [Providencia sneebia]|uniref:GP-PDE domain-containing protein n=1 Tax=Providencia sneebia DSM 19967 TaxID=1141660 RepID=K8W4R0_9GAMM|nr:DUF3846 domain-containing protein [Providencia sneebia]EKT55499.1 hypothetical protein OO7_10964 [Providencia sneebia DSM 19967]EKT55555.1 hypothetical protein OO7_11244 [Providencia sneebia DSM 19967]
MAIILHANNSTTIITPEFGNEFMLAELQEYVGGYIQTIDFNEPVIIDGTEYSTIVIDEDGKHKKYPINTTATQYAKNELFDDDFLVGDVIFLKDGEIS